LPRLLLFEPTLVAIVLPGQSAAAGAQRGAASGDLEAAGELSILGLDGSVL
jgi:hypothetical protein